jgi:acid phosphatase
MELRFITIMFTVLTVLALFVLFRTYNQDNASFMPPLTKGPDHKDESKLPYQLFPFTASWSSWFYPGAWVDSETSGQRAGKIDKNWNILYHLGGNGPWVQKIDGVIEGSIGPPRGCTVEQVHMVGLGILT